MGMISGGRGTGLQVRARIAFRCSGVIGLSTWAAATILFLWVGALSATLLHSLKRSSPLSRAQFSPLPFSSAALLDHLLARIWGKD